MKILKSFFVISFLLLFNFNVFAEVDGRFKLIYTDKLILNENITVEETTATALKIQIVNTEIGNDNFIIQGVSAYYIE